MPVAEQDRLKAALAHRYQLERAIGRGGMATVYLAEDLKHHRKVAIKVLKPELAAALGAERFLREIEIVAKLTHPHILPLHDSGEADGFLYYVMPYVEGESLQHRLRREKQLPLADALRITCEVADALQHAHRAGIIHRDIKPANILLEAGHAVVSDFGIARAVSEAGGEKITVTGHAVGTPVYMSFEQAAGDADVDGRSDEYSLACVLYEMLAGQTPYTGATPAAILAEQLKKPAPSVRAACETVPPAVDRALCRALATDPGDRFANIEQFVGALEPTYDPARIPAAPHVAEPGVFARSSPLLVLDAPPRRIVPLIRELGRRRVLEVFALALAAAILGVRTLRLVQEYLGWADWTNYVVYVAGVLGLLGVVMLAWASGGAEATYLGPRAGRVIEPPHVPVPIRWAARLRPPGIVGLLALGTLGLVATLVFVPPALPAVKSLVVLPFMIVGEDDPKTQALADGLVETLTSKLTQLEQFQGALWVVPSAEVRGRDLVRPSEARRAFGVSLVIAGSVQRSGDHARVNVNLVDAETMRQLRSHVVDESLENVSALQDGIFLTVVELLRLSLRPDARELLLAGGTKVAGAYEAYLEGLGFLGRHEQEENIDRAIQRFTYALERDPDFALAHAALGEAYWLKYESSQEPRWAESARRTAVEALVLEDRLVPVRVTLGKIYAGTGRYELAEQELQKALRLDSTNATALVELAKVYDKLDRVEEAEAIYRRGIALRPDYWGGYHQLGKFYFVRSRYEEAAQQWRRVVELTPDNAWGWSNLGAMYYLTGRYEEAAEMYQRATDIKPHAAFYSNLGTVSFYLERYAEAARAFEDALRINDGLYDVWRNLGSAYMQLPGSEEKAREAYERAARMIQEHLRVNPRDGRLLILLADCYAMVGRKDEALRHVSRALEAAPYQGEVMFRAAIIYEHLGNRERALEWIGKAWEAGYSKAEIERAPSLANLREDPRFQELAKR